MKTCVFVKGRVARIGDRHLIGGFLVPTAAIPDEEQHALETHPELLDDRKDIVACKMP